MSIIAALALALLISMLFSMTYGKRNRKWTPVIYLFFILFMAGIAGQYWIVPMGPSFYGIYWVPLFFIVTIFALLFTAPFHSKRKINPGEGDPAASDTASISINAFTWLLVILLMVAILFGIYRTSIA
jgi:hypothetical protein